MANCRHDYNCTDTGRLHIDRLVDCTLLSQQTTQHVYCLSDGAEQQYDMMMVVVKLCRLIMRTYSSSSWHTINHGLEWRASKSVGCFVVFTTIRTTVLSSVYKYYTTLTVLLYACTHYSSSSMELQQ